MEMVLGSGRFSRRVSGHLLVQRQALERHWLETAYHAVDPYVALDFGLFGHL